jgi:hypothetical protein
LKVLRQMLGSKNGNIPSSTNIKANAISRVSHTFLIAPIGQFHILKLFKKMLLIEINYLFST